MAIIIILHMPVKWFLFSSFILLYLSSNCYWLIQAADTDKHLSNNEITRESTSTLQQEIQHLHQRYKNHSHTVQVNSLLPAAPYSCNSSPIKGRKRGNSLEVRHRHGSCYSLNSDKSSRPTHTEILQHDQARVDSIRSRIRPELVNMVDPDRVREKKDVELPAKSGITIGSGNFIVTIGLGTPKKELSLIFDTGSDFTWTQCKPCAKSCYKQKEPIFDPSASSTYTNITCKSEQCSEVGAATSASPGCSGSTCIYGIQYGDSSFSVGFFAKDTLYLGPKDAVPNFLFGCGENNQGLFGGSAGLIGLGRNKMSIVSQTASQYGSIFSYCLPSKSSSTGHLTFGKGGTTSKAIQYTSLSSSSAGPSFYFIELQGMMVGGRKLSLSPTVFSSGGTLIDSGTVITRLPPDAYSALQASFSKLMSKYPKAPSLSILDTCYDFSKYSTVTIPKITLLFGGGAKMELHASGILYVKDLSQVCLAFAANSDAGDVGILGNVQQLTYDIIYDVAGGKLGFGPGGCV